MASTGLSELIKGAQMGKADDVAALAARFQKMILVNCALRIEEVNQVEDAAQEVTEQMLAGICLLKSHEAFTAWLERIIEHTCARSNQRSRTRKAREVELDAEGQGRLADQLADNDVSSDPEASFAMAQARELLLAHLRQLPQSQRVPLMLHYFGAMGYRQIAEMLHVKVGTVSSNIAKGKRNLNRRLLAEASYLTSDNALDRVNYPPA
jgi:RNA polymerase sigma-70 factor (ECF subfamily)